MFNDTFRQQLTTARDQHLETELILEGRTIFPSLVTTEISDDAVTFTDSDGSQVAMLTDVINGVIVHTQSPQWYRAQQQQDQVDVRGTHSQKQKVSTH